MLQQHKLKDIQIPFTKGGGLGRRLATVPPLHPHKRKDHPYGWLFCECKRRNCYASILTRSHSSCAWQYGRSYRNLYSRLEQVLSGFPGLSLFCTPYSISRSEPVFHGLVCFSTQYPYQTLQNFYACVTTHLLPRVHGYDKRTLLQSCVLFLYSIAPAAFAAQLCLY